LCVEGELDSFAISQLWMALDALPPKTGVLVDLATGTLSRAVLAGLGQLCDAGVPVTIRGDQAALGELRAAGLLASDPPSSRSMVPTGRDQPCWAFQIARQRPGDDCARLVQRVLLSLNAKGVSDGRRRAQPG
jgi:hypothetical protein